MKKYNKSKLWLTRIVVIAVVASMIFNISPIKAYAVEGIGTSSQEVQGAAEDKVVAGQKGEGVLEGRAETVSVLEEDGIVTKELTQCKNAIKNGRLRIAFVGDSITEGADLIDINNSYPNQLVGKIKESMKDVNIEFQNFSLGSRSTVQFVDDLYRANYVETDYRITFNRPWAVQGKSWKDHVRDFNPDLVILAFGMNDAFSTKNSEELYYKNIKKITEDIKKWTNTPDIVFVSTILPTKNEILYDQSQDITNSIAQVTRSFAKENGYICADANRLFQILRDGIDIRKEREVYYTEKEKVSRFYNGAIEFETTLMDNGVTGSVEMLYRKNNLGSAILKLKANKDESLTVALYFSDSNSIFDENKDLGSKNIENIEDDLGNNISIIKDEKDNEIKPYKKIEIKDININTPQKIKIEVEDIYHKVYINDTLVMDIKAYKKLAPGKIDVRTNGLKGVGVKNLDILSLEKIQGEPLYSEEELVGKSNDVGEGNGINHPTTLGHRSVYLPTFNKFFQELIQIYEELNL